jgi:hypothetical protein
MLMLIPDNPCVCYCLRIDSWVGRSYAIPNLQNAFMLSLSTQANRGGRNGNSKPFSMIRKGLFSYYLCLNQRFH